MHASLLLAFALVFQGTPANTSPDALTFLQAVTQRYSDAKSYHIEATAEHSSHSELLRDWNKKILKAIVAPGGRHWYEGHSGFGSGIRVSNGTTSWNYHVDSHAYTEKGATEAAAEKHRFIAEEETASMDAEQLVPQIRRLAARLKSARFLPDESIVIGGHTIECRVVQYTDADFKVRRPDLTTEETIWVEKSGNVIVKTASRSSGSLNLQSGARLPLAMEHTTVFEIVELDQPEPDTSFVFTPPPDAKLVASFPDPSRGLVDIQAVELLGKPAPDIRFRDNGKDLTLSSYRGKPVFIEFWSTSCAPCLEQTPELKQLYAETASKGLVWLTFDNDEDPSSPERFTKQEQIPWPNYDDSDGSVGKAFGRLGVPLAVLIDAEGKVTFYKAGYEMSELRAAIVKLGPAFASVAPSATQKDAEKRQP